MKGYAQLVKFIPKIPGKGTEFHVFNLYLDSRGEGARGRQLKLLTDSPHSGLTFVGGDFNFVMDPDDTSLVFKDPCGSKFTKSWIKFLETFGIRVNKLCKVMANPGKKHWTLPDKTVAIYARHKRPRLAV